MSILLHLFIFIGVRTQDISANLPRGYTVIGKVKLIAPKLISPNKVDNINKKKSLNNAKQFIAQDTINKQQSIYLAKFKEIIELNKKYPFVAKKMQIEGKTEVEVTIFSDGSYKVDYTVKSVHSFFNQATEEIFKNITSFDVLPDGLNTLKVTVPIWYKIN